MVSFLRNAGAGSLTAGAAGYPLQHDRCHGRLTICRPRATAQTRDRQPLSERRPCRQDFNGELFPSDDRSVTPSVGCRVAPTLLLHSRFLSAPPTTKFTSSNGLPLTGLLDQSVCYAALALPARHREQTPQPNRDGCSFVRCSSVPELP